MSARDAILASIRDNLAASAPFDAVRREHYDHSASVASAAAKPVFSQAELIENFRANLESLGAHCTIVAGQKAAAETIVAIINKRGARRIAISDSELVKSVVGRNSAIEILESAPAAALFECDLGVTSAQWAIAETGTLVMESEKEWHRFTSLVPPIHVCVIKAERIRQTLGEILALISSDLNRTVTFITGASRTSDIELTLAIGVHGPEELHVVVIAD